MRRHEPVTDMMLKGTGGEDQDRLASCTLNDDGVVSCDHAPRAAAGRALVQPTVPRTHAHQHQVVQHHPVARPHRHFLPVFGPADLRGLASFQDALQGDVIRLLDHERLGDQGVDEPQRGEPPGF